MKDVLTHRWYGRGAADCKGNIVMHLTALRAEIAAMALTEALFLQRYAAIRS